jgi:hypothetical protein
MVANIAEWIFANLAIPANLQPGQGANVINLATIDSAAGDPPAHLAKALSPSQTGSVRIGPILLKNSEFWAPRKSCQI